MLSDGDYVVRGVEVLGQGVVGTGHLTLVGFLDYFERSWSELYSTRCDRASGGVITGSIR